MARNDIFFHLLAELQTVHHGHHHVRHNQVRHLLSCHFKATLSILGFKQMILVLQDGTQIGADVGIVIDNQHGWSVLIQFNMLYVIRHWSLNCDSVNLLGSQVRLVATDLGIQHLVDELGQVMGIAPDDGE